MIIEYQRPKNIREALTLLARNATNLLSNGRGNVFKSEPGGKIRSR